MEERRPVIDRMRERSRRLRRMAGLAHNREMIEMLLKMAGEIDSDIARVGPGKD